MIDAADDQVERPAAQRAAQTDVGAGGRGAGQPVRQHVFGMPITVVVREVGKGVGRRQGCAVTAIVVCRATIVT